jgi:hypothetical protein
MTQEQKDIILHGARYEIMNTCINYITGVVDVEKMAEGMQRYAEMYHRNELSKLGQHDVIKNEVAVCDNEWHESNMQHYGECHACGLKTEY